MTKLRLNTIEDSKPVKLILELPAPVHRDLSAYADAVALQTGRAAPDKAKLATEMLTRFMATDRGFAKYRRGKSNLEGPPSP